MTRSEPTIRLAELAHARSGDKGNRANIGVVAFDHPGYTWLERHLTAAVVGDYLKVLGFTRVSRFELPNLLALNFVLDDALAGGASRSLRLDSQGKALGTALLELRLPAPPPQPEPDR